MFQWIALFYQPLNKLTKMERNAFITACLAAGTLVLSPFSKLAKSIKI
jgi:hypothetical protein